MGLHPSHKTRFSFDASTWDEICIYCGATDQVPGGWGKLASPCPNAPSKKEDHLPHTSARECPTWADYYYTGWFGCNCHMIRKEKD